MMIALAVKKIITYVCPIRAVIYLQDSDFTGLSGGQLRAILNHGKGSGKPFILRQKITDGRYPKLIDGKSV